MMTNRKLKEQARIEIRKSFQVYAGSGMPEHTLVDMLARHCIGLLEYNDTSFRV